MLSNKRINAKVKSGLWLSVSSFQKEKAWKLLEFHVKNVGRNWNYKIDERICNPKINVFIKMYSKNYKKGF